MNIDARVVKHPRRLVVRFDWNYDCLIRTDDGDRPQLVHFQDYIDKPSLFIRFATRLRLTKGDKSMMDAVEKAYAFVYANYRQGDQVILLINSHYARHLDAAEMLAKHLHGGTRPSDPSRFLPENVGDVPPGQIPIHCVAVLDPGLGGKSSVSERNDELKSRFPPGIEHIICWAYENGIRSCATRCDADGSMISREICISKYNKYDDESALLRHCTKHVIYYDEDQIPKWDDHEPVWTHKLDSSHSDVQGGIPFEATRPFGMYVHELRRYQGLPGLGWDSSILVWKSYRGAGEHT